MVSACFGGTKKTPGLLFYTFRVKGLLFFIKNQKGGTIKMVASPALTQVAACLRPLFERAVATGKINPRKGFRIVSVPCVGDAGAEGWRNYFLADDDGNPLHTLGSTKAKPTICD